MSDDLTPTPEDYAVDPRAMLELAAKATKPPWTPDVDSDRGYNENNDYGRFYLPSFNQAPFADMCMDEDGAIERQAQTDAEFLCLARTALPALARRLIAAEAALKWCIEASTSAGTYTI